MYNNIVIALALDHGFSSRALKLARNLVNENGKITAIHVSEPVKSLARLYITEQDIEKAKQAVNEEISKRLEGEENIQTITLAGHAGSEIPNYAEKSGADCIIVGSHKPGLDDFLLGSTSARVVRHAQCSVHVLR